MKTLGAKQSVKNVYMQTYLKWSVDSWCRSLKRIGKEVVSVAKLLVNMLDESQFANLEKAIIMFNCFECQSLKKCIDSIEWIFRFLTKNFNIMMTAACKLRQLKFGVGLLGDGHSWNHEKRKHTPKTAFIFEWNNSNMKNTDDLNIVKKDCISTFEDSWNDKDETNVYDHQALVKEYQQVMKSFT